MKAGQLHQANIDNLTSLWKKMGTRSDAGCVIPGLNASATWPNRYWFDRGVDTTRLSGKEFPGCLPNDAMVPVWDAVDGRPGYLENALLEGGMGVVLEQRAMYLDLDKLNGIMRPLKNITRIDSENGLETWTDVASRSFGYEIDIAAMRNIVDDPSVRLLLVRNEGQAAATVLLYRAAGVVGIHQLGVIPEQRGKGIAYALMEHVIAVCNAWRCGAVTLQASAAAESMYQRQGFKSQFMIRTYQRRAVRQ